MHSPPLVAHAIRMYHHLINLQHYLYFVELLARARELPQPSHLKQN